VSGSVGVLLFVPEARYGTALSNETGNSGLAPGYWLNFEQATLVAMWSDTEESTKSTRQDDGGEGKTPGRPHATQR
jgi:hypothetical protein